MSNVINLNEMKPTSKEDVDEQTVEDRVNHFVNSFEEYIDYWLDSVDSGECEDLSILTIGAEDTSPFTPTKGVVLLQDGDRFVCVYSDSYHQFASQVFSLEEDGDE